MRVIEDLKRTYDSLICFAAEDYYKSDCRDRCIYIRGYARGIGYALGYEHEAVKQDIENAIEQRAKETEASGA